MVIRLSTAVSSNRDLFFLYSVFLALMLMLIEEVIRSYSRLCLADRVIRGRAHQLSEWVLVGQHLVAAPGYLGRRRRTLALVARALTLSFVHMVVTHCKLGCTAHYVWRKVAQGW